MKEFLINNRDLIDIELDFWEALTVSDMAYNTVFAIYSAVYGTRLDGMNKHRRFKLTRPDPDYFIKKVSSPKHLIHN